MTMATWLPARRKERRGGGLSVGGVGGGGGGGSPSAGPGGGEAGGGHLDGAHGVGGQLALLLGGAGAGGVGEALVGVEFLVSLGAGELAVEGEELGRVALGVPGAGPG